MNKKQKTLLITGGLGGIGSEIVDFFYHKNFKIIILDNKSNNIFLKRFKFKNQNNKSLIYKKHSKDLGLIESYGKNINDAIRKRDEIAFKNMNYMFDKISKIKF